MNLKSAPSHILSFVLLGLTSMIGQVVIQREFISGFYGNEFFVGIILASWLAWIAAGSGMTEKIIDRIRNPALFLAVIHISAGTLFFLLIFFIRCLKYSIGLAGEIPNLAASAAAAFLVPAPLCLVLGLWWTGASRTVPVARAYLLELLGFIAGGVAFSFLLVRFNEFSVALALILLNILYAICLLRTVKIVSLSSFLRKQESRNIYWIPASAGMTYAKRCSQFLIVIFLAGVAFIFTPYLPHLDVFSNSLKYKNQSLQETTNTFYGNIAVTKTGEQYNFFENGVLLGTTEKTAAVEEIPHLPLLEHPSPKKVLLIGGGFYGILGEILKHPVDKVYYVETDPGIIQAAKRYVGPDLMAALSDPKVELVSDDSYYFVKNTPERFDVIIANLPPPSSALIGRFYSREFYKIVLTRLESGGIFSTILPFSGSTPNKELEYLNASVYNALKSVFADTITLPEEANQFISSNKDVLTYDPAVLIKRFRERKIKTDYISDQYINFRLTTDRIAQAMLIFETNAGIKENTNRHPTALFFQNLFWLDHFYPHLAAGYKKAASYLLYLAASILIILPLISFFRRGDFAKASPFISMAAAGCSIMIFEMIVIYLYQIEVGYLYHRIALLISAVIAGMALGTIIGGKMKDLFLSIRIFHVLNALFSVLLVFSFTLLSDIANESTIQALIIILAILSGFFGSAIFPIANKIFFESVESREKKTGAIYSADMMGSALGALLASIVLIPIFGIAASLYFVVLINASTLLLVRK